MKRLAVLIAVVGTFAALADPIPPPRPKCDAKTWGSKCVECKGADCLLGPADAGLSKACEARCSEGVCPEVWCPPGTPTPPVKRKSKD